MNVKILLVLGCVAFAGLPACSNTSDVLAQSQFLAERHNFHQAYWVVAQALDENPNDRELERVFWERRLAYLLDRGQQLVFQEQEQDAIAEFQKALALDPENEHAKAWIRRAEEKLANEAVRQGETLQHQGDLEGALKLYNKANSFIAEYGPAMEGIAKVNELFQRRADKATDHYVLGSRARGEQQYQQSYYHSGIAHILDESLLKAKKLRQLSGKRLASTLLKRAKDMEAKGFYSAALHQYQQVKLELPDAENLDERIDAMANEVLAREKCREAEMLVRKKDFDKADKLLEEAFQLSQNEKANVSGLMRDTKRHRYDEEFRKAKDLELEYRFEAALAAFEAIDKAWKSEGFEDVKTRISSLRSHIEEATKAWKAGVEAEKANKIKEAIDHFEEAVLVYPGFQGLDARIKELRTRIGTVRGE